MSFCLVQEIEYYFTLLFGSRPLDLCDPSASNPDVLPIVYQGSHASNLVMLNQGAIASMLPTSGASSSLQGSSGVVLGSNSSSPFGPLNAPLR